VAVNTFPNPTICVGYRGSAAGRPFVTWLCAIDSGGRPTGFADLDALTTGLQKSDLVVVAARPSVGKTSFALNIAE